jgi:hypothetical protein
MDLTSSQLEIVQSGDARDQDAGIVPGIVAAVAIVWARLPQDELAHPLRDD